MCVVCWIQGKVTWSKEGHVATYHKNQKQGKTRGEDSNLNAHFASILLDRAYTTRYTSDSSSFVGFLGWCVCFRPLSNPERWVSQSILLPLVQGRWSVIARIRLTDAYFILQIKKAKNWCWESFRLLGSTGVTSSWSRDLTMVRTTCILKAKKSPGKNGGDSKTGRSFQGNAPGIWLIRVCTAGGSGFFLKRHSTGLQKLIDDIQNDVWGSDSLHMAEGHFHGLIDAGTMIAESLRLESTTLPSYSSHRK